MSGPSRSGNRPSPDATVEHGRPSELDVTLAYHARSKHHPFRFAPSLGYMDWATQPDPFRRFAEARMYPLELLPVEAEPAYDAAFTPGSIAPAPLDRTAVSRLFQDALALSAWKQAGAARWALRVNPSSGNLHPTEGYLLTGPVAGLHPRPAIFHYTSFEHALELRAEVPQEAWLEIAAQLPEGALLVGLTSIYWRESWKYGERGFRYCHHDAGHAIASVAIAAAGLGWETRLLESVTDADLALLLGVHTQAGVEAEHADCLMAVFGQSATFPRDAQRRFTVPATVRNELRAARWSGAPNRLSRDHHPWPAIDEVAAATEKHAAPTDAFWSAGAPEEHVNQPAGGFTTPGGVRLPPSREASADRRSLGGGGQADLPGDETGSRDRALPLRQIIHQRRSAVALDGRTELSRATFDRILQSALPGSGRVPFATLPWRPCIDLLLFVHRVADLTPGAYVLVRDPVRIEALKDAMDPAFAWVRPEGGSASLPLFHLESGDARSAAQQTSCDQEIAADGAFAVAMLADYRASLESFGAWHYRRLYWETGAIGQVLYLEAEAAGIRGTGIGCFFDDLTHRVFGLSHERFQVLYHFTMGGPLEDPRLQTHPPYQHRTR